jgi:hypothetical protein
MLEAIITGIILGIVLLLIGSILFLPIVILAIAAIT